ncbi:hypothetical protein PCE1_000365 [Barthelona sp. PCE]
MSNLPFLPGLQPGVDPRKTNFAKGHKFDFCNGLPVVVDENVQESTPTEHPLPKLATDGDENVPQYVKYDRMSLRFLACFYDDVGVDEKVLRKLYLNYFLDSDTCSLFEPNEPNSGLTQGAFLKPGKHIHWTNIKVGEVAHIYGRDFYIWSCDDFTREFYKCSGFEQKANEPDPQTECPELPTKPKKVKVDRRGQFLQYDGKVLRFWLYWDTRGQPFGELRHFTLHFFLADDTTELYEIVNGRPSVAFLKRNKLLTMDDLRTESVVNIFGREMYITHCDAFTYRYFAEMGIEQNTTCEEEKEETEEVIVVDADPDMNFLATMQGDRAGRKFVIKKFENETISIFEVPSRNSGFVGGKFLERFTGGFEGTFKIGEQVLINSFVFDLVDADDLTKEYLKSKEE